MLIHLVELILALLRETTVTSQQQNLKKSNIPPTQFIWRWFRWYRSFFSATSEYDQ